MVMFKMLCSETRLGLNPSCAVSAARPGAGFSGVTVSLPHVVDGWPR